MVDDFDITYIGLDHAYHIINKLEQWYEISIGCSSSLFCGMSIKWDYHKHTCNISMPGNIEKSLTNYQYQKPARSQHCPHKHIPITYGAYQQPTPNDTSPPFSPAGIKHVQDIVGILLCYAWAVDSTLVAAVSFIAARQAKGMQAVQQACDPLFDYVATHPHASLKFIASDMILVVHTNASYLSELNSTSCTTGHFSSPITIIPAILMHLS